MSTFLAIDSSDANDTAEMSTYFEGNVYPYLQSKGFTLSPFFGALARPEYVAPAVVDPGVTLLMGVGHGTYSSFQGFQEEAVFSVGGYTADQVQGKIIHFLSCETAKELGPDFVANGCLAYIGYDENFTFDSVNGDTFFNCDAEILRGLADGLTVGDAVIRAKNLFAQTISNLMAQGTADAADAAQRLQYNLLHLRSPLDGPQWGRTDVTLT
jgi:hypothetical protein